MNVSLNALKFYPIVHRLRPPPNRFHCSSTNFHSFTHSRQHKTIFLVMTQFSAFPHRRLLSLVPSRSICMSLAHQPNDPLIKRENLERSPLNRYLRSTFLCSFAGISTEKVFGSFASNTVSCRALLVAAF